MPKKPREGWRTPNGVITAYRIFATPFRGDAAVTPDAMRGQVHEARSGWVAGRPILSPYPQAAVYDYHVHPVVLSTFTLTQRASSGRLHISRFRAIRQTSRT